MRDAAECSKISNKIMVGKSTGKTFPVVQFEGIKDFILTL